MLISCGFFYESHSSFTQEKARDVVITRGGYSHIAQQLYDARLLPSKKSEYIFLISAYLTSHDGALQAGEFHFPQTLSIMDILWCLRHGTPVLHNLTIPEGITLYQFNHLLLSASYMEGEGKATYEGELLPQTYSYKRGQNREKFVLKKKQIMDQVLGTIWQGREENPFIKTPNDLLILASLVEKETSLSAEKPVIARVFLNRLQDGMKLQMDPSVIYALTQGQGGKRKLTHDDLHVDSPYNTYLHEGLPPTAICFPGRDSLLAVAHPSKDTKLLYFVATGHGGHYFTDSFQEHERNIQKLRAAKNNTQHH